MREDTTTHLPPSVQRLQILADALEDSGGPALQRLLTDLLQGAPPEPTLRWLAGHRVLPAVARRLRRHQFDRTLLAPWGTVLAKAHRTAAVGGLLRDQERDEAARTLAAAGIPCAVIKGGDLGSRVYESPEDREAGDIDLLIASDDLELALRALISGGWQGLADGSRYQQFLRSEGYCWQAHRPQRPMIEIHFRLWGLAPEPLADQILGRCRAFGDSPALRPQLADAYLVAAVHAWTDPGPRPLATWWDLQRIVATVEGDSNYRESAARQGAQEHGEHGPNGDIEAFLETLAQRAIDAGLQLPVAAAATAAARLFDTPLHRNLATRLRATLSLFERRILERVCEHGEGVVGLRAITLARLLTGRPSRSGWRAVGRRLWAHPGVVERETDPEMPWFRRRLQHVRNRLLPHR